MAQKKYIVNQEIAPEELVFTKLNGLVPVITQEAESGMVLMSAFATKEALQKTRASGYAHYYSRSRSELWEKGATSGNRQRVIDILVDCDKDTLLYIVEQEGDGACHTGDYSCFHYRLPLGGIDGG